MLGLFRNGLAALTLLHGIANGCNAQNATTTSATSSGSLSTSTSTGPATAITVATDGSAQYTAINAAIAAAQNSAIPSVVVQAGTYSEALTIQGTQTVTVVGPSASNYAGNQVVVAAAATAGVVSFNTQKSQGVTFRNVNITNTISTASSKAPAISAYGMNLQLDTVALVSGGLGVYTAGFGTTLLYNSYVEGSDKLFYNYVTLYVYGSTIVPTANSASIFYGQGYQIGGTWYNATIVVDSSAVQQKPGLTNSYVYLAAPNGNWTQAIYRGSNLGSLIAPTGVRASVCNYAAFYGEFQNTGAGAMTSSNAATKNGACDQALTAEQMAAFSIDQVFGHAFSGFSSYSTSFIDSSILDTISQSDAAQVASAPSSTISTTSSSSMSSTVSSQTSTSATASISTPATVNGTSSISSTGSSTLSVSSSASSPPATTANSTSTTVSSTALTAVTVGPTSAQFTDINSAVAYAQNSGIPTVSVQPGTYSAFTIMGSQTVTIAGPTATAVSDNQVIVSSSNSAGTVSFGTGNSKGVTLRNLNITNGAASSGLGPAVYAKGINLGIYTCALTSSAQGVYSASYGVTIIANSYISGSDKLFYNVFTAYVYGSTLVPTVSGTSIIYGKGATFSGTNYNATIVVDSSSVQGSVSNVYLATPNGAANYLTAIYRNSSLSGVIAAGGVYSTACNIVGTFGEFETTGAGSYSNNAASRGSASCDYELSATQVSAYTIDQVFINAFPGYTSDTAWIDPAVLSAIQASDAAQVSSASATSTASATVSASASSTCLPLAPSATLIVSQNATACQYSNVSSAISALPNDNSPYTIKVMPGTYTEQISITRNGKVTLIGDSDNPSDYRSNKVTIQYSNGQLTSAGKDESTPVLSVKKTGSTPDFSVYNIAFVNTYPQTANTAALAADFYGTNFAAYQCSFFGFQDTLLANQGAQVFSGCYVEGSIDYIWGFGSAYFYRSVIATNTKGACVTAQGRVAGTDTAYVFDDCFVTYTSTYGTTFGASYLGRPYSAYATVVYKQSYIDKHIAAAGWEQWSTSTPNTANATFGEYNNTGPGSWQAGRVSFAHNFTAEQVAPYSLTNVIGDTSFIDSTAWNYPAPFNVSGTATTTGSGTPTGPTTTASIYAHPESGTTPPQYAVLVSPNGAVNGSFPNVTAALASLPADNTNQTIFVYAGTYTEQVPSINRPGAVRIIGYTTGNPGESYKDNQVTITFSRGLSVSPLPSGHSDAETATVSTASNTISFYNINIINSDNLDGLESSYVTLAASIYGSQIGFYACYFQGWQDTLLTGSTTGYQYYESCMIEGAIDFIWGYSAAYFKGCTIGAKRKSSAMTAQSRASSTAIGGYIFDECLFTAAPDATVDLTNAVYLGRPYSQYALVVVKHSYIDDVVNPSGWKVWSATDPRTAYITFAEYKNTGPSAWQYNVAAREAFGNATLLTSDSYTLDTFMASTAWIDMTYWNSITTPQPEVVNTTTPNITVSGNSTYNGTVPPAGALLVSKSPIAGQTVYPTIQDALNAAPTSSKTNATIFIYPGVYEEQLIVNKSGTTIFIGYSEATDDYSSNQVTIQQSYGVDTQGTGHDVDAATVYATGNFFYSYNINFFNNNGTQQNIASLGFAVQSSKYAFMHACQIAGNQDTLYVLGSLFTFKSYIVGNIDFIFGGGSGYFLSSTIAVNEDGNSITASKRTTNATAAGFVFDQSSIVPAPGVDATGWNNVSLGRPWNNFARVAYVDCYLSSMIGSPGWDQWSKSTPNTDGVVFSEYHNYGPGSNVCARAPFSEQLTDAEVSQFQLQNFFTSTSFIDFSVIDVRPFSPGIGSAPPSCNATSSLPATTSTSSSSLPLVTVYTTRTYTDKEITSTTLSLGDVTSTAVSFVTENDGTTVTPAASLKTSVVKETTIITSTSSQGDSTTTIKSTETSLSTATVSGKDTTVKSTVIGVTTETYQPKPSTVKETTTIYVVSTKTPNPTTITESEGTLQTVYKTSTQKAKTITSTILLTAANSVKTSTAKASTTTISSTSIKTTAKGTTITCSPTAAARMFRRGLEAHAAGTTTLTINATVTSFTKTSTISTPGSTYYTTVTSTSSIFPETTLKAATSTILSTSYKTSTQVITESGSLETFSSIATKTSVTTITNPGSTTTSLVSSLSTTTLTLPQEVTTSYKIVSSTSVTTLPIQTVTSVKSADSTTTLTTTLPAETSTKFSTSTVKGTTSTIVITPAPSTKTTTVKSTSTVFTTKTKSSSGAPACTG